MGCFDYVCDGCEGDDCGHRGSQNREATVIIEVPLSDGTTVYLKGEYEEYGYVTIKLDGEEYEFYPIQFKEYFKDWFKNSSEKYQRMRFLAHKVYTYSEYVYASELHEDVEDDDAKIKVRRDCSPKESVKFTNEIKSKCIRADGGRDPSEYIEELKRNIKSTENDIEYQKTKLERLKKELTEELELLKPKEETVTTRKRKKSPKTSNV
jgi:hypothetical protein